MFSSCFSPSQNKLGFSAHNSEHNCNTLISSSSSSHLAVTETRYSIWEPFNWLPLRDLKFEKNWECSDAELSCPFRLQSFLIRAVWSETIWFDESRIFLNSCPVSWKAIYIRTQSGTTKREWLTWSPASWQSHTSSARWLHMSSFSYTQSTLDQSSTLQRGLLPCYSFFRWLKNVRKEQLADEGGTNDRSADLYWDYSTFGRSCCNPWNNAHICHPCCMP